MNEDRPPSTGRAGADEGGSRWLKVHTLWASTSGRGARGSASSTRGDAGRLHEREFTLKHPRPGWAEQDPDEWWSRLVEAVKGAMEESGVPAEEIAGISMDATSSTVLAIDEKGRHLRPAIMWMDVRASDQADRIAGTDNDALKYNGYGAVSAEWGLPKALWIKENEPEVYKNARHICDCGDWLIHRLTGEWAVLHQHRQLASTTTTATRAAARRACTTRSAPATCWRSSPQDVLDLGTVVGGCARRWPRSSA